MDIIKFLKFLEDKDTFRCAWGPGYIETTFDTMPSEFIGFAEADLQSTFDHKYINALSNAKRALDCQADRLLKLLGYYEDAQKKFWGFPRKLELIQKFEVIAPRILNKVNKVRNLMEHQYIKPNATQVEDFLDITSLFVASTEHYTSFYASVDYINEENEEYRTFSEISLEIDHAKEIILITPHGKRQQDAVEKLEVHKTDGNYIEVFKRHLKKIEFR